MVRAVTSVDATALTRGPERGDEWAYRRFYRDAVPRLVAFLVTDGAAMREAAGYAQGALIDAHRQWSMIDNAYRWCRLEVYARWARHRDRHTDASGPGNAQAGAALINPLGTAADWLRDHHGLLRALDLLPRLERDVFAWAYDGAGELETARALRVSPETVRDSIRRARAGLEHDLDLGPGR
jgi:RNA polymerase sigma-70 factor (ECF subfamily)